MGMGPDNKVVVIGGGHGLSTLLRGLKDFTHNLTAVVTVADDAAAFPDDLDLLVVVHPKTLGEAMQYRIDQFVLGGGRLVRPMPGIMPMLWAMAAGVAPIWLVVTTVTGMPTCRFHWMKSSSPSARASVVTISMRPRSRGASYFWAPRVGSVPKIRR